MEYIKPSLRVVYLGVEGEYLDEGHNTVGSVYGLNGVEHGSGETSGGGTTPPITEGDVKTQNVWDEEW